MNTRDAAQQIIDERVGKGNDAEESPDKEIVVTADQLIRMLIEAIGVGRNYK